MAVVPLVAWAQPAAAPAGGVPVPPPPAGAGALVAAATTATPAQVWRDVQIVWLASRLGITPEQAKTMVAFTGQLQKQLEAGRATRAQLWQEKGTALNTVIAAWAAGNQPDEVSRISAEDAGTKSAAEDQAEVATTQSVLAGVMQNLTDAQKALIETTDEAQRRAQVEEQLEGAPSAADFVIRHMMTHRQLTTEEYALLRHAEAGRVARRLVGGDSATYTATRDAVLRVFDQVNNWSDDQLAQAMPNLPDRIRDVLQLAGDQPSRAIRNAEVLDWVRDARTPKYLAIFGTQGQPLTPDPDVKPEELVQALETARILTTLNGLRISAQQIAQLGTIAGGARVEAEKAQAGKNTLLASAASDLGKALPYLIAGQPLDEQWTTYLTTLVAKLKEQDDALNGAMIPLVSAARRVLGPGAGMRVDWRLPPAIAGLASPDVTAERARQDAAQVKDALQLVDGLRPMIQVLYLQLRIARIEEFLSQYVRKDTPVFERLRDRIADQITDARGLTPEEWDAAGPGIAVEILNTAGQLIDQPWRPGNQALDWYAIRDLLLNPQTGPVLQKMLAG